MTVKGGTSQACAACKYQRRKCASDCPLAPYFPADKSQIFRNAHKLFGVSNILKILRNRTPLEKSEAMTSIIYESNIRERYPVHGCWWVISDLQCKIHQSTLELEAVNQQLSVYRQQYQNQISPPSPQLQLGTGSGNNALQLFQPQPYLQVNAMETVNSPGTHNSFSNGNNAVYKTDDYIESKDNMMNPFWVQSAYTNNSNDTNNNNSMAIQSQYITTQAFPLQQVPEVTQEYDEMPTFFDTIDDRQSYIDSKDPYESSSDSSFKDMKEPHEHVAEKELKNAAANFTLTSVN